MHDVGYRVFLTNIALEFGIDRFNVFSTFLNGKESVVCLIDAEEEILNGLKERIKTQIPDGAIIEKIKYADYRNTVPPIERCMQVPKNLRFLSNLKSYMNKRFSYIERELVEIKTVLKKAGIM
ncbi:MAG: hypothetical protein MASP_01569 [Candidatus Methanolliviera sp. GoM_asphalt]|nr:MAG: hypothetical protein MASP_01569 [Candidatus Methanolliviera sp. GoM_asphalt]